MKCGPFHTRFSTCVKALHLRLFVQFQKMSEVGICGDALQLVGHYSLNIFSEIPFYRLSLYIRYLQMFSFGLNTHGISLF